MEEYIHGLLENKRSTEQVFSIVPGTTSDPFATAEAARQALRFFRGEANPKLDKSSSVATPLVGGSDSYGTDEM